MAVPDRVVITGLMGSGKSTVGRRLAERLGRTWFDSDRDIEAALGLNVRDLREREGVDAMHAREAEHLLEALTAPGPSVISAAASVIDDPRARAALVGPGIAVFWLRVEPSVLAGRFGEATHRPAYGPDPAGFLAEQAAAREPFVDALGAGIIEADDLTVDEIVARILTTLG